MAIRWTCKCGQPLEVADDHPQRVTTCPKCIRSIAIPFPEEPLSDEAARYLKGSQDRGNTKKMTKPIKCSYCGWLIWQVGVKECPKCLRKVEEPSIITTIVGFALLVILGWGAWAGYGKLFGGGAGQFLDRDARVLVSDRALRWKAMDAEARTELAGIIPDVLQATKGYAARARLAEAKVVGAVDGVERGRILYTVTLWEYDPSQPPEDPTGTPARASATLEQKMVFQSGAGHWVADGDPTVVDRTR